MTSDQDNPNLKTFLDADSGSSFEASTKGETQGLPSGSVLGRRVGNIEIVNEVGRGNMGTVYRAVHRTLKTPYAVKVLHRKYSQDVNAAERFRREALVCSRLRHPNVVFVTDFGFQKNLGIYIIMEFLDGLTLSSLVNEGPMEAVRACHIAMQIADALEAAHQLRITHRDLKPDNITILEQGHAEFVKVLDFGIASMKARHAADITTQGMVLGTPAYMAPEQVMGLKDKVGARTDIYALGCILYELLTGRLPFYADSPLELCRMHIVELPMKVSEMRTDLADTMLVRLISRMLEKDGEKRPGSMAEVRLILKEAARQLEYSEHEDALETSRPTPVLAPGLSETQDQPSAEEQAALAFVEKIWRECPDGALSRLFSTHPALLSLPQQSLFELLWGPLARDLLDTPSDEPSFDDALRQVAVFVEHVLNAEVTLEVLDHTIRNLGDLMVLVDRHRQQQLVRTLQPLTKHPHFPIAVLPYWATAHASGTWKPVRAEDLSSPDLKITSSSEIQLIDPDRSTDEVTLPSLFELSTDEAEAMSSSSDFDPNLQVDDSLIEKLRQPISVRNLKEVFKHEIFTKRGELEDDKE